MKRASQLFYSFLFNDTATTEIYALSLHDALPISCARSPRAARSPGNAGSRAGSRRCRIIRSEEHTSELQSHSDLVCRLLLEKNETPRMNVSGSRLLNIALQLAPDTVSVAHTRVAR